MIDSIDITTPLSLRDRALIGLMVFSFARIGAALGMKVEDVFTQNLLTRTSLPQANAYAMRWRQSRASPGLGTMSVGDRLVPCVVDSAVDL